MMKKPLFLISLALTFMLMILSCEKDDTNSTTDNTNDDKTSNDSTSNDSTSNDTTNDVSNTIILTLDDSINGTLQTVDDEQIYSFEVGDKDSIQLKAWDSDLSSIFTSSINVWIATDKESLYYNDSYSRGSGYIDILTPKNGSNSITIQTKDISQLYFRVEVEEGTLSPGDYSFSISHPTTTDDDENSNLETGSFTDSRDGTVYKWVKIGDQVWMAENLKATEYSDGTAIPLVTDNTVWENLDDNNTDKAYCWYDNDSATNKDLYGALYTYAAAINGDTSGTNVQGVCPSGWHLPSDAEWTALTDALGGASIAGDKLKATSGWNSDGNGTDDIGFAALPGGSRYGNDGSFRSAGISGNWWSSTEIIASNALLRFMAHYDAGVSQPSYNKSNGFSVRCVRD